MIGLGRIKDYQIAAQRLLPKHALQNDVIWKGELVEHESSPVEVLTPFFNLIWAKCGSQRPESRNTELSRRIGEPA
jgi:hypothetical protein